MFGIDSTPDGWRVTVSREIEADADEVWRILTDTHEWRSWGVTVVDVESNRRYIEEGTEGKVEVVGGFELPFRITYCDGKRWSWKVAKIPATGHSVEPVNETKSVAKFEIPPAMAGYSPVCMKALKNIEKLAQ